MNLAFEPDRARSRGRRTVYLYSIAASRLAMVGDGWRGDQS